MQRPLQPPLARRRPLRGPLAVILYLSPWLAQKPQERMLALLLDGTRRPLGLALLGQGGLNETTVDLRVLVRTAAAANAAGVVLAHNHPTNGRLRFSTEDRRLTKRAQLLIEALGCMFVDHLLFAPDGRVRSLLYPAAVFRVTRNSGNSTPTMKRGKR